MDERKLRKRPLHIYFFSTIRSHAKEQPSKFFKILFLSDFDGINGTGWKIFWISSFSFDDVAKQKFSFLPHQLISRRFNKDGSFASNLLMNFYVILLFISLQFHPDRETWMQYECSKHFIRLKLIEIACICVINVANDAWSSDKLLILLNTYIFPTNALSATISTDLQ